MFYLIRAKWENEIRKELFISETQRFEKELEELEGARQRLEETVGKVMNIQNPDDRERASSEAQEVERNREGSPIAFGLSHNSIHAHS